MRYIDQIQANTFAAACYEQNSINELIEALLARRADPADCGEWKITPTEWRESIALALRAKIEEKEGDHEIQKF